MTTPAGRRRASLPAALDTLGGLLDAAQAIAVRDDPDSILQLIADRVRTLIDARYAALGIVGSDGMLERFITSGLDDATRARIGHLPVGLGLLGLTIREQRSIRVDEVGRDPRSSGFPPHHPPMHDFLGVPVVMQGRSVGNLYLTEKRGGHFDADDQRLVEAFAVHAGIAIENARLVAQVNQLAVMAERERISADLHDGLIQNIYAIGLGLEDVPALLREDPAAAEAQVERAIESLHLTIRDVRNLIYGLQPELLGGVRLMAGLAIVAEESRHNTLLEVEVEAPQVAFTEPDQGTTADLLAIVSEALTNVARHARATRAWVRAGVEGDALWLTVADDGIGIQAAGPLLGHQGLRNMRQRAEHLGGTVEWTARDGGGTVVQVRLPRVVPTTPTSAASAPRPHDGGDQVGGGTS